MTRSTFIVFLAVMLSCGCRTKDNPPPPPTELPANPSLLAQINATQTSVTINWFDAADNEDGYRIQQFLTNDWLLFRQVGVHEGIGTYPSVLLDNLVPGQIYRLRVVAFNEVGSSDPSNVIEAQTSGGTLPLPPTNLNAAALSSSLVRISWSDPGTVDSFLVQRHGLGGAWGQIGAVADNITLFDDHNVSAGSSYYYRVGSKNIIGVAWTADSALVTIPSSQVPPAPDSLQASVQIGVQITLTWLDRSTNEDGFALQRGLIGEFFEDLATLGANSTSYIDHPPTEGIYNYQVRAFNGVGASAWNVVREVNYRYCSPGLIPICLGNWWRYVVTDSVGPDIHFERTVYRSEIINGDDFYLLGQHDLGSGPVDSLYFLKNAPVFGTLYVEHPLPVNPNSAVLYRYPANSGEHYIVGGDCVFVFTGQTVVTPDTTYENCYYYQTLTRGQVPAFSKHDVYIVPQTIGIVREIDRSNSSTIIATRDLTAYFLR
jgi:hypothetical protein